MDKDKVLLNKELKKELKTLIKQLENVDTPLIAMDILYNRKDEIEKQLTEELKKPSEVE